METLVSRTNSRPSPVFELKDSQENTFKHQNELIIHVNSYISEADITFFLISIDNNKGLVITVEPYHSNEIEYRY